MQPTLCTRCKKNLAVVFVTRLENGETKNEGLCLKCARSLGIKPVDDMIKKMGISEDDLDAISNEMLSAFGGAEEAEGMLSTEAGEDDDEGRTATFPFLNKLFGGSGGPQPKRDDNGGESADKGKPNGSGKESRSKRKFLENYCISLTQR
ncbi:MAG: ATP-dependent Clp protease ATP-binding subunit, partial [Oscillospiraceae bacterium]|nr:ATP-dependent Clp protease ATP-binding subunit [Oscillospiraceae bacterium]